MNEEYKPLSCAYCANYNEGECVIMLSRPRTAWCFATTEEQIKREEATLLHLRKGVDDKEYAERKKAIKVCEKSIKMLNE